MLIDDVLHDITSKHAHMYEVLGRRHHWSLSVQQVHRDMWQQYGWREWPYLHQFERELEKLGFRIVTGSRCDRRGWTDRIVVL